MLQTVLSHLCIYEVAIYGRLEFVQDDKTHLELLFYK